MFDRVPFSFDSRIIAAVRDRDSLLSACKSRVSAVFLLRGDVMSLRANIARIKDANKKAFVHMDLVDGIAADQAGIRFAAKYFRPDGVISTRPTLLRFARDEGLTTIQRIFLMDSASLETGVRHISQLSPDFVEVLPGLVPRAIAYLTANVKLPVIAGGMVTQAADVEIALSAGAVAVSTSNQSLWDLQP